MLKILAAIALCASLGACASMPQHPRMPDPSHRVPINRTVPPEVQNGVSF
jgi:hypothetical protein